MWEGVWGTFFLFSKYSMGQWGLSLAGVVSQACGKGCAGSGAEFPLCSPQEFEGAGAPASCFFSASLFISGVSASSRNSALGFSLQQV